MNRWFKSIGLAIAFGAGGCATLDVTHQGGKVVEPKECSPRIFLTPEVGGEFETLCKIDSRVGNTPWSPGTQSEALEEARTYACGCGANAIVFDVVESSLFHLTLRARAIRVPDKGAGLDLAAANDILRCRDLGGQWAEDHCEIGDSFGDTPISRRRKATGEAGDSLETIESEHR